MREKSGMGRDAYKDGASNKGWDDCDVNVSGKGRRDEIR